MKDTCSLKQDKNTSHILPIIREGEKKQRWMIIQESKSYHSVCVCVFVYYSDQTHYVLHWILQTTNY